MASDPTSTGLDKKLQAKLLAIEQWARRKRVNFNVFKCKLLPHRAKAKSNLSFFDLPLKASDTCTYLEITFTAPRADKEPWGLQRQANNLASIIRQRSRIFKFLRRPRFQLTQRTLRMIFDGWIGGLISYSNPILAHCIDEKLEVAYRTGLKTFLGLPISTPNSIVYAAAQRQPPFDQRHARSFTGAGRLLALPDNHPFASRLWTWKRDDPQYICQKSSLTLERDALPNISPLLESQDFARQFKLSNSETTTQPLLFIPVSFQRARNPAPPDKGLTIWTDGGYDAATEEGSAAVGIWRAQDDPLDKPPTTLTAKLYPATSSTQAEMTALTLALDWVADHAQGEQISIYSDSLSALTYVTERYYKSSLSKIKNALASAFCRAAQVARITFTHIPGHSGILQNDSVDRLATTVLRDSTHGANPFDLSYFSGFARDFLSTPSDYALQPRPPRPIPLHARLLWERSWSK